jgi:cytochrome P450
VKNVTEQSSPSAEVAMFERLPLLDVYSPEFIRDPHSYLRPLRGIDFARSERGLEVLSYVASEEVLRLDGLVVGFEEMLTACGITDGPAYTSLVSSVSNNEGEVHTRQRRVIAPYFQPRHVETMRAALRSALEDRFAEVQAQGRCDLVDLVGRWLPTTSFCMMAGVPFEDRPFIWRTSEEVMHFFEMNQAHRDVILSGFGELETYVDELIAARRKERGDDLVSFLVTAEERADLSLAEVRDLLILLVLGSTDTTNGQTAFMFSALASHPDQWHALRDDQSLVPNAVLETSRHEPGVWTVTRVAREGALLRGLHVPENTPIFIDFIAANRDPSVFADPDTLDVRRDLKRPPLNWSVGRHFCPGRPLVVLEMEETLRVALHQWKKFEIRELNTHGAPYVVSADRLLVDFQPTETQPKHTR